MYIDFIMPTYLFVQNIFYFTLSIKRVKMSESGFMIVVGLIKFGNFFYHPVNP